MVEVGTGGIGSKYIRTDWPIEEGLEAGTTKQTGRDMVLKPQEEDLVRDRYKVGIY